MNFEFTFFPEVPMALGFFTCFPYWIFIPKKNTRKAQRPKKVDVAVVCQVSIV